jgi:hypothetical protein
MFKASASVVSLGARDAVSIGLGAKYGAGARSGGVYPGVKILSIRLSA